MKDLWIEEQERLAELYMEDGMSEQEAEELANIGAMDAVVDRLADAADRARDAAKYAEFE
jgi:hypothetical protein